jgi:hypothetical protein
MTSNNQGNRHEAITNADVVGKVFVAVSKDMRRCLVCDRVFTTQCAAEHAGVACRPSEGNSGLEGGSDYANR